MNSANKQGHTWFYSDKFDELLLFFDYDDNCSHHARRKMQELKIRKKIISSSNILY